MAEVMVDTTGRQACDACAKQTPRLFAWKFTDHVLYKRRLIEHPWLCLPCIKREKKKLWGGR